MKIKLIAALIITALSAQSAIATDGSNYDLGRKIVDAAHQLYQIADTNNTDICSGDVLIAAAYLESAAAQLQRHKKDAALVSMTYGQNELKEISTSRSYCAHLAPKVKPVFAQVIGIKSELEGIAMLEKNQTRDTQNTLNIEEP